MRRIVHASLNYRFIVVALAAGMMFFGVTQLRHMPVDVFPEFAPTRVEVQTTCLGLSATEVESLVTIPLESAMNGIPGLDTIRSKSVSQVSSIELIFKQGTDQLKARQLVQERMSPVMKILPTWAAPPVLYAPVSTTGRVMEIGLSSKTMNLRDMSMTAYWRIRARLLRVRGVSNVAIWGERLKMLQVQADPSTLKKHGVTLENVMTTTSDALDAGLLHFSSGAMIGRGGFVDTPNQRLQITPVLPITSPAKLAQVPIERDDGTPVPLGSVTDVVEGNQPLAGDAVINGRPGLMLVVEKFPWANTLELTRGVESALREMKPGLPGINIEPDIFQAADFIHIAIGNLTRALVIGSLLVLLVLGLFLWEWRTALISLIAIPTSLIVAVLVLRARGATINTIVLTGMVIAVGVVVDDAIIDIENIVRRLREARTDPNLRDTAAGERSMIRIVLEASLEVRSAIIYATLIDVATLLPILFVNGLSGALFRPLALSYGIAVLASLVVALTVTPALAMIMLRPRRSEAETVIEQRHSPFVTRLQGAYERALRRVLDAPLQLVFGGVAVVLVGAAVVPQLGQSLLPQFKERDFLIHFISKPGTSLPEERRLVESVSRRLGKVPGVRSFGSHIGQAFLAEEIVGVNFGENWITLKPHTDYNKTLAAVNAVVNSYPGLYHDQLTYFNERVNEVLAGSSDAIVVRVYGQDFDKLQHLAKDVKSQLSVTPGVVDEHVEFQEETPQVLVTVNIAKAQAYGLKPGDVRRASATLLAGEEVGDIYRDGKAYDVQVWSTPNVRRNLDDIRNLTLDASGGRQVRLADVADVRVSPNPNSITRENDSRRIDVDANVSGRDLGSVVSSIKKRLERTDLPLGYHTEVLGEFAERQSAQGRLLLFAGAALIGVFLLLRAGVHTWRLAWLAFLDLPIALAGGLLAIYLFGGRVISLGSLVGFLTVLGISTRNGIMMINHFQHLERVEGQEFGPALVLRGARERLSPIMMTALATGLAVIPLVLAGNLPGHEIEHPMAVVIVGGLLTSTFRNLFILPTVYLRIGHGRRRLAA